MSKDLDRRGTPGHVDGSLCLKGIQTVPDNYVPCCAAFEQHTLACTYDLRYEWAQRLKAWAIVQPESSGGDWFVIAFCPHCGKHLQPVSENPPAPGSRWGQFIGGE